MNADVPANVDPLRTLTIEGGCNFRDIGGYATADGVRVRWRRVYRSGVLSYFSEAARGCLDDLGVRAICDLRRADEREREPTRWPDRAARGLFWNDGADAPSIRTYASRRGNGPAAMRAAMIDLYQAMPRWLAGRLNGIFQCLAAEQTPLVIHCAAGKDRTGVAVAVLLELLGVDRETILADYLLTNEVGDFEAFARMRHASRLGLSDAHHPLLSLPADVRAVLFTADADYLNAALEQIDREHGGVRPYLRSIVGLSDAVLNDVRAHLTEPA